MGQLVSVRSNQNFMVDYGKGKLIPQTEVIVFVSKPIYNLSKNDTIKKDWNISENRFTCTAETLNYLIGQLQMALKVANQYEQMAGSINEVIINTKPVEGSTVV